jgi:DNA-binding NtrC family response regulator
MTVLLVEDDPIVRSTLADFLEDAGCALREAENVPMARAILGDPAEQVTVLVTDINLGPGDDGLTLAAEARAQLPGLAIFYVTGSPERLRRRPPPPTERVFLKPFNADDLVIAVRQALDSREPGSRPAATLTSS